MFSGTYYDAVSSSGQGLSDYMLLCSVVATILVIVNTAQVCFCFDKYCSHHYKNKNTNYTFTNSDFPKYLKCVTAFFAQFFTIKTKSFLSDETREKNHNIYNFIHCKFPNIGTQCFVGIL